IIMTAAHQVSEQQSSVRPIQTGQPYVHPPAIRGKLPSTEEAFEDWRDRIALIPGKLTKMLIKAYSGVSSSVASQLIASAHLTLEHTTDRLSDAEWHRLFDAWQAWLQSLKHRSFTPATLHSSDGYGGYTVLATLLKEHLTLKPADNTQTLLHHYYQHQFNQEEFRRLHHQLSQATKQALTKLRQKANTFAHRLQQSNDAEIYRQQADLLMAYLSEWQAGMTQIELTDFDTGEPVVISLNPEKNAVQNAQSLYKQHQKLKRARTAVTPLLASVNKEISYLEQVEDSLLQVSSYQEEADLKSLEETRLELIEEGYLRDKSGRFTLPGKPYAKASNRRKDNRQGKEPINFHRYQLPQGVELFIGRNNSQNEQLTFKYASDYDLWLHAQEIPGSHVLLRLNAGEVPTDETLALSASFAAYYSRARQSEQVPVVITEPKHVYKPKGALPGMVIYKHEQVLWGQPQHAYDYIENRQENYAQAKS
ncbi:MAG: NFACT family protein, partial [Cyanobacteria bacterium J06632_3]